jgi:beta-lactamase regulating signal transducer with metallopeptidase domain/Mg-chelatase subunit ChlD
MTGLPLLVEVFWKSGVVLGAALCLNELLRKKSADLRRLVLSTAIATLCLAAPVLPVLPRWTVVTPVWLGSQNSATSSTLEQARSGSARQAPPAVSRPTRSDLQSRPPRESYVAPFFPNRIPAAIPLLWLLGTTMLLARFAIGLHGLRRLRSGSHAVSGADLQAHLGAAGTRRRVTLLQNQAIAAPVTWGILRPVILVPAGFEQLPVETRNAVLCHESAHIQANDFFLRVLAEGARALLWFQPLIWIVWRKLRQEQELARDNRVLAAGGKPSTYAKVLMDWEGRLPQRDLLTAVGMAQESCLKRRLYALLDPDLPRDAVSKAGRLAFGLLGLATALPLAALSVAPGTPPAPFSNPVFLNQAGPARPPQPPANASAQVRIPPVQRAQVQSTAPPSPSAVKPPRPAAAVVLVIDKSSSMVGRKIELSRAAATAVVENLRPEDRIGILTFDSSFQWQVPIRPADDKASLKRLIAGIYPDGGTMIPAALAEAYQKLLPNDTTFGHIVLLTDGISGEGDSERLAKDASDHKVTISTIGLGEDVNRPFLERIADGTGGKAYFLNYPGDLEQIMLRDVQEYTGSVAIK